jgi:dipeptidase E
MGEEKWVLLLNETDVLLVNGGDGVFLSYWLCESGWADLFSSLPEKVYVGLSGGSMALTPRIGRDFMSWTPPTGDDETLGLVDFSIFPHLDHEAMPGNSMAEAERWAATIPNPCYLTDDQTTISVVDGTVEVISEGHWKLVNVLSGTSPASAVTFN